METIGFTAVLLLITFVPILIAVFFMQIWHIKRKRSKKHSPLTHELLRAPGEYLIGKLNDIQDEFDIQLTLLIVIPLAALSVLLYEIYALGREPVTTIIATCIVVIAAVSYIIAKLHKLLTDRANYRLGLDGERAVAQELNLLMHDGCWVYHDLPAEGFNIDHIVISKAGIFALETKTISKTNNGNGTEDVKVTYDGKTLQFPCSDKTDFIDQTNRQAMWLSKWLSDVIGEPVKVQPVLVLPGWFVNVTTNSPKTLVINPNNSVFLKSLSAPRNGEVLSDQQIKQIKYQIDKRCRISE